MTKTDDLYKRIDEYINALTKEIRDALSSSPETTKLAETVKKTTDKISEEVDDLYKENKRLVQKCDFLGNSMEEMIEKIEELLEPLRDLFRDLKPHETKGVQRLSLEAMISLTDYLAGIKRDGLESYEEEEEEE
jgi:hypothetical protein